MKTLKYFALCMLSFAPLTPVTAAPPTNLPQSPSGLAGSQKSADWLSGIDSSTRAKVDDVFKQNAEKMNKSMEGKDEKAMQAIFESNQESLKNELQKILSAEDYQKFLNSLPSHSVSATSFPSSGLIGIGKPMEKPTDWLSGLDRNTRAKVDDIFKQNALRMQKVMESKRGAAGNEDMKAMQKILESNQESLKNDLKKVLSPKDYASFLNSFPTQPELTALPKNEQ